MTRRSSLTEKLDTATSRRVVQQPAFVPSGVCRVQGFSDERVSAVMNPNSMMRIALELFNHFILAKSLCARFSQTYQQRESWIVWTSQIGFSISREVLEAIVQRENKWEREDMACSARSVPFLLYCCKRIKLPSGGHLFSLNWDFREGCMHPLDG
jgi:hypothetical protein